MGRCLRIMFQMLSVLGMAWTTVSACQAAKPALPPSGRELFHRDWSLEVPLKSLDGVGPMYNAVSCIACHNQGGVGGGGNNDHNVQLLTLTTTQVPIEQTIQAVDLKSLREHPLHPALATTSSVVLHRFSTNPDYYPMLRMWASRPEVEGIGNLTGLESLGITHALVSKMKQPQPGFAYGLAYAKSQRNTPSLFGLGYIDAISMQTLEKVSKVLKVRYPEVSGRVAPNGGKFGWRGQSASVRSFVLGACANEVGLQTPGFAQAADPALLADPEKRRAIPAPNDPRSDMTEAEIAAMVRFVAELQPPKQTRPITPYDQNNWLAGRKHFTNLRCDACHVRQIGALVGIYSDLLLHDMGEQLNDPAALSNSPGLSQQYYGTGESLLVSDERKQEWRTPPLWGVRDSAPYLHDGRAATIEDAILAHGGEGELSRRRYESLSPREKRELVRFVMSLGASNLPRMVASAK